MRGTIHNMKQRLVIVNIAANAELLSSPRRFCSEERLLRAERIIDPEKRLQSYAAELALSYALSGEKLLPPIYRYEDNGRPVSDEGFISVSHTEGFAAAAVSPYPVGVDIERRRAVSPALARKLLCPAEEAVFAKGENPEYLLEKFVVKEAFLKMTGEGISGGMRELFDKEGLVFRKGVLAGYLSCADSSEYFCRAVGAFPLCGAETALI